MSIVGTLHCVLTLFAYAMAIEVSAQFFMGVFATSLLPFVLYKLAIGDFWSKLPIDDSRSQNWVSFFMRIGEKMIADFCMTPLLRHPTELGFFWFVNLFLLPVLHFFVFYQYDVCETCGCGMTDSCADGFEDFHFKDYVKYLRYAYALAILNWAFFFLRVERKSLPSFVSFRTGKDYKISEFNRSSDHQKVELLISMSSHYFVSIVDDIKEWIQDSWELWNAEETFTLEKLANIPEVYIPVELHLLLAGYADEMEETGAGKGLLALMDHKIGRLGSTDFGGTTEGGSGRRTSAARIGRLASEHSFSEKEGRSVRIGSLRREASANLLDSDNTGSDLSASAFAMGTKKVASREYSTNKATGPTGELSHSMGSFLSSHTSSDGGGKYIASTHVPQHGGKRRTSIAKAAMVALGGGGKQDKVSPRTYKGEGRREQRGAHTHV